MTSFPPGIRIQAPWLALWLAALLCPAAMAQGGGPAVELPPPPNPNPTPPPANLAVERIDATRFRVGEVTFDQKTREIRFPAVVNLAEGLLEYAIVRTHGKVHESLLATEVHASAINLAFTLLRYQPSEELYAPVNDRGGLSSKFPEVPEATKAAARIQVKIEWDDAGKTRTVPLNEWIQHGTKGDAMPETLWVYGGSFVDQGKFMAETTGDIIAIFTSGASLINFPGKDHQDDSVWFAYPKRVPVVGTKVTVIFAPNPKLKKDSQPEPPKAAVTPDKPVTGSSNEKQP